MNGDQPPTQVLRGSDVNMPTPPEPRRGWHFHAMGGAQVPATPVGKEPGAGRIHAELRPPGVRLRNVRSDRRLCGTSHRPFQGGIPPTRYDYPDNRCEKPDFILKNRNFMNRTPWDLDPLIRLGIPRAETSAETKNLVCNRHMLETPEAPRRPIDLRKPSVAMTPVQAGSTPDQFPVP